MEFEYDDSLNLLEEIKNEIDLEEIESIPIYRKDNGNYKYVLNIFIQNFT